MSKDAIQVIKDRVSTRSYLSKEIPDELMNKILEAGHLAASAGNLQSWEFYVVKNEQKIEELSRLAEQEWMVEAPRAIVVCANPKLSASKYGSRGRNLYCVQDTAAAIENILLAAEAYELGSCWVGSFDESMVRRSLGIREELIPMAIITIGYSKGKIEEMRPQKSLEDIITIIN